MQRRSFIKLVLGGAASLALPWAPKAAADTVPGVVFKNAWSKRWPSGLLYGQLRLTSWNQGDCGNVLSEKFPMRASDADCGSLALENDGEVVIPVDLQSGYWQLDRLFVFDDEGNELFSSNMDFHQVVSDGCTVNVGAELTLP